MTFAVEWVFAKGSGKRDPESLTMFNIVADVLPTLVDGTGYNGWIC
jgi:hypothetical protein